LLEGVSTNSVMNYFRCEQCGHVWTIPKDDPEADATAITIRKPSDA
jgi:hypothetical protein